MTRQYRRSDPRERLWSKVDCDTDDQCWLWGGGINSRGYGYMWIGNNMYRVHRLVYEFEVGKIPDGHEVHHKCNNPACVNPYHLQAVSHTEHMVNCTPNHFTYKHARQTHCINGHEFNEENTYLRKSGGRACRQCTHYSQEKYRSKKLEQTLNVAAK